MENADAVLPQPTNESLAIADAASSTHDETRPTVIVMHASVGSGHRSAANAVAQAFALLRDSADDLLREGIDVPADLDVEVIDVLGFGRHVFDGDHAASLFTGATRPIYDLTWRFTLTGRMLWGGGTAWSHVNFPRFTDHVRKTKPLAIVCTHITAANVAVGARMLSGQEYPIVCVPTDYETEGLWPHKASDLFCVANEFMAETLRPRKVPEERILITGIPTRTDFRENYDERETRERFGLPQDKTIVLALAGAYLPQPYVHFRDTIDKLLPYLHVLDRWPGEASEPEGSAAVEDDQAQADEDDREQDVLPALQRLCDRPTGGDELGQAHQHRDQGQEHDAVGDHGSRADAEEDRDVDADVVPAVGEGHPGHRPHPNLLALDLCLIVIVGTAVAPGLPRSPKSQPQRNESEVGDDLWRQERSRPERHQHGSAQDASEPEVLSDQDSGGGPALARASGEEQ